MTPCNFNDKQLERLVDGVDKLEVTISKMVTKLIENAGKREKESRGFVPIKVFITCMMTTVAIMGGAQLIQDWRNSREIRNITESVAEPLAELSPDGDSGRSGSKTSSGRTHGHAADISG